jgi:hypothetical protein
MLTDHVSAIITRERLNGDPAASHVDDLSRRDLLKGNSFSWPFIQNYGFCLSGSKSCGSFID